MVKNKLSDKQLHQLPLAIRQFAQESNLNQSVDQVVNSTWRNIVGGIKGEFLHDIWIHGDLDFYCLCKVDFGADGEAEYTAYQLWIRPDLRNQNIHKKLIKFLRFYAQKHNFKRLNIISSRLDCIQAYQRGIGYEFKPKYVIFSQEM